MGYYGACIMGYCGVCMTGYYGCVTMVTVDNDGCMVLESYYMGHTSMCQFHTGW